MPPLEPISCRKFNQNPEISHPTLSTIRVLEPLNCRKCKLELKHCRKCNSERNCGSAVVRMRYAEQIPISCPHRTCFTHASLCCLTPVFSRAEHRRPREPERVREGVGWNTLLGARQSPSPLFLKRPHAASMAFARFSTSVFHTWRCSSVTGVSCICDSPSIVRSVPSGS